MYYIVKRTVLKKNGRISLTAADSSLRPLSYFTSEYRGTTAEFLQSASEGNFHLQNGKGNYPFLPILEAINAIEEAVIDARGLDLHTAIKYRILEERRKCVRLLCETYARAIETRDYSNPAGFGEGLGTKLFETMQEALGKLEAEKEKDKAEGRIRISCAAASIFKEQVLLHPEDGNGFLLAPKEDYDGAGLLKTNRNTVPLGPESEDLYAFLSFTGVDMTEKEYMVGARSDAERKYREGKLKRVDEAVKKGLAAGLELISTPYRISAA